MTIGEMKQVMEERTWISGQMEYERSDNKPQNVKHYGSLLEQTQLPSTGRYSARQVLGASTADGEQVADVVARMNADFDALWKSLEEQN